MENTIFLILAIVIILIFVMSIAIIHIRALRDEVNIKWYNLVDTLQYRQDLIPNLIETIRRNLQGEALTKGAGAIDQTIEVRARAAKNSEAGSKKIVVEHDLSRHIRNLIELEKVSEELARDTNFLELKKELSVIREKIEELGKEYNKGVRHHNSVIKRPYNIIPAVLMRYKKKYIFEFE